MYRMEGFYNEYFQYLKLDKQRNGNANCFPVGKIDGLPVVLKTMPLLPMGFHMFIKMPFRNRVLYDDIISTPLDLERFIGDIKQLKFNNLIGRFENKECRLPDFGEFFVDDNLEVTYEECVICYEKTTIKTRCGHPLCIRCESSLVKNNGLGFCPVCRKKLTVLCECDESDDED
jgi:hypothetical protein